MCQHSWGQRHQMATGSSYLCYKCGAQLRRVFDTVKTEEEADELNLVEDVVMEMYQGHPDQLHYPLG
jgi:hypothetical protein